MLAADMGEEPAADMGEAVCGFPGLDAVFFISLCCLALTFPPWVSMASEDKGTLQGQDARTQSPVVTPRLWELKLVFNPLGLFPAGEKLEEL